MKQNVPDFSAELLALRAVILNAIDDQNARLDRIEELLRRQQPSAEADERLARLLAALAASMGEFDDLPFSTTEVLNHRRQHHELDTALEAIGIRTTQALGNLFRELKGKDLNGLLVIRDGRLWRLVRTSCT